MENKKNIVNYLLKKFFKKQILLFLTGIALIVCCGVVQAVILPDILGKSLQVINQGDLALLNLLLVNIFLVSVFLGIVTLLKEMLLAILKRNLDCSLQRDLVHQLWFKHDFYKMKKDGLSALFRDTVTGFCGQAIDFVSRTTHVSTVLIVGSVYSLRLNPLLYGICIILIILLLVVLRKRVSRLAKSQEEFTVVSQEVNKKSWEQVQNHEVEGFLNPKKLIKGYHETNLQFLKRLLSLKKVGNMFQAITLFATFILMLCIGAIGGSFVLLGQMQIVILYQMLFVMPNISKELFCIPELIGQGKKVSGLSGIICGYFDSIEEIIPKEVVKIEGGSILEIENVSFGYHPEKMLFEKVSCTMESGEYWAFTGNVGCGKSTFLKILICTIPLEHGTVGINGKNLLEIDRGSWWDAISYLDQTPHFIKGTVRDNIVLKEPFHQSLLDRAIQDADLKDILGKLPEGIDSFADTLSSGEKQKVCFARVFYRNRNILFLDEATSALDPESEDRICKVLKEKTKEGWLVVGIAHREQFTSFADKVLHFTNKSAKV